MNSLVGQDRKLVVLHGHIYQYTVTVFGSVHFQAPENFCGPVERINKTATAFGIHPDLAAGLLFGVTDSTDDTLPFVVRKKFFPFREGEKCHGYCFRMLL